MLKTVMFMLIGYLSGSILFARLNFKLFNKENALEHSKDNNPGTANAFMHGGFWCGTLTLIGDLLKGFLPIFLFVKFQPGDVNILLCSLVLAAPVIGHVFPIFFGFKGGKGIAAAFGCLLGLLPMWQPVMILAVCFIFFSVVLRITPHFHRTLASFVCSFILMMCLGCKTAVWLGFMIITLTVSMRMLMSREEKERMKIKLLWMR